MKRRLARTRQFQPEIGAVLLILYMILPTPFGYEALIVSLRGELGCVCR